ncbi:hypothetical protein ACSAZK_08825 [Methanosarcina sp. Mfa9]|uniref:hypothetical protein n=1 Tax=Methanosarcina sp. Mfa9 TaxID=3439063 RepID=UPI003F87EE7D
MAEFMDGFSGVATLWYGPGFCFHPFPWLNLWKIEVLENLVFRVRRFIFAGFEVEKGRFRACMLN